MHLWLMYDIAEVAWEIRPNISTLHVASERIVRARGCNE